MRRWLTWVLYVSQHAPPRFQGFRGTNEIYMGMVVTRMMFLFGLVSLLDQHVPLGSLRLDRLLPRLRTAYFSSQLEGCKGVHQSQVLILSEQERAPGLWSTTLVCVSSGSIFVVTLLTYLALGQVIGMAQRWCAIPKPDASAGIVGGHDVCEISVIYVFVLWFQLLEWEE